MTPARRLRLVALNGHVVGEPPPLRLEIRSPVNVAQERRDFDRFAEAFIASLCAVGLLVLVAAAAIVQFWR